MQIRKATLRDSDFLAEAIIGAEKGNSSVVSFCTLFDLSEEEVKKLLVKMLEEEIEGCELSLGSFLLADDGKGPVAAVAGWIENVDGASPSAMLKSNLILYSFPKNSMALLKERSEAISGILIPREPLSLQIEYVYVSAEYRGKHLAEMLIRKHENNAMQQTPAAAIAQVQVFANNHSALKLYERIGYEVASNYRALDRRALNFLPNNEKLLMQKNLVYGKN
jgi:ribosomal protein S18 acetylase RimI-like enzyme